MMENLRDYLPTSAVAINSEMHKPPSGAEQLEARFRNILSATNGYCGQFRDDFGNQHNVGYAPDTTFTQFTRDMSVDDRWKLQRVITYFEIHMRPLKNMLHAQDDKIGEIMKRLAWSHFAVLIMFGMVELAIRCEENIPDGTNLTYKEDKIQKFFKKYLSQDQQDDITRRYRQEDRRLNRVRIHDFDGVIHDLWKNYRSAFVHEGGVLWTIKEGTELAVVGQKSGIPVIGLSHDISEYEWLKHGWDLVLASLGYMTKLKKQTT